MLCKVVLQAIICTTFALNTVNGEKNELRIHTLVPQKSEDNRVYHSDAIIPAAIMAVDDVNNNPDYLPDYNVTIKFSDSRCDASEGIWQTVKSILDTSDDDATNIISFLGDTCSLVSEPTAALLGKYGVLQITSGSASPLLSDRSMFPFFFRTYPSQNSFNDGNFALMNMYGWCNVATIHQTVNLFSLATQDFHDRFDSVLNGTNFFACIDKENDGPILVSFTKDPEIPLKQVMDKDVRIIFGYFYEENAVVVMCYAKNMGLTSDNHLWILPGWYSNEWWIAADSTDWSQYKYNCTSQDIIEAIEYSILLDFYTYPTDPDATSISGYTNATFQAKYKTYLKDFIASDLNLANDTTITVAYETITYDAVWAIATALNKTENVLRKDEYSLADFEYYSASQNGEVEVEVEIEDANRINTTITNIFTSFMSETNFEGVSGNVQFDENGTRIGNSVIYQMRYSSTNGLQKVQIAIYNFDTDGLNITFDLEPQWRTGRPPTDRSTPVNVVLNQTLIYFSDVIIGIGIIIAVVLLIFNIITVMKPFIANSAPYINTIIIIGCIIMMSTCVLLGIDSGTPAVVNGDIELENIPESAKDRYSYICIIRLWFLTIGFTLSFGALFGKTWQVYRVYTNSKLTEMPFKMWNFLIIMGIQLFLDLLLLSVWTGLYPFEHGIDHKDGSDNSVAIYEYCKCDNIYYFIGALYLYKGLLVIFGLFLAYESRNVKYFYINDSRFVSIAMYIVVILIGISAPLSILLSFLRFIDAAYAVAVLMTILSCLCCLLVLYIPKFYYLVKGVETTIPKLNSEIVNDNLKLENSEDNHHLKQQDKQKDCEADERKPGSDQDSGIVCTSFDEPGERSNPESQTGSDTAQPTNISGVTMESVKTQQKLKENGDEKDLSVDSVRNEEMIEGKTEDKEERKSENDKRDDVTDC